MDSLENTIMVHAAISGSTNCLLHLPAIAHEFGLTIDGDIWILALLRIKAARLATRQLPKVLTNPAA